MRVFSYRVSILFTYNISYGYVNTNEVGVWFMCFQAFLQAFLIFSVAAVHFHWRTRMKLFCMFSLCSNGWLWWIFNNMNIPDIAFLTFYTSQLIVAFVLVRIVLKSSVQSNIYSFWLTKIQVGLSNRQTHVPFLQLNSSRIHL